tara:strand:- start:823 stop:1383 length:561 start_codon:yes stop_codon:yes gene_type:complete
VKSITEDILSWSKDFIELPNKHLGNLPTCPYAKTARLKNQIKIIEQPNAEDLLITIIKQCQIIKKLNKKIIIIGCPDLSMTADELVDYIHALNHVFVPKDVYLMCHHPEDDGEEEPVEFLEDTDWYPENTFMMVLIQPFMELENASEHLNKTGFYDNWTQDYYEGTVKKRQSYRRLYYGRNEKKSK